MSRIVSQTPSNLSAKLQAFPYQYEAFLTVRDLDYSAIFHEQGLGKTKIAIDLILYWLKYRDIDTVLIVTKKQLVNNWLQEFAAHTYIAPKELNAKHGSNFFVFNSPSKVVVTNFETVSTEKERMKLFLSCRNVAIIIDESTKLKNPESKLTQDFFELSDLFKIKTIMTGTPVANRPYDIWAQIFFLDKGKSLGTNFKEFKKRSDLSNDLGTSPTARQVFEESVGDIFPRIAFFSVRETKKSCSIELPQKVYRTVSCEFESKQYDMYRRVVTELELEIKQGDRSVLDDEQSALKRLLRLLQITSNPALLNVDYDRSSGKESQLESLLEDIVCAGEKVIVWSSFIGNVDAFTKKYSQYNPRKIHGSVAIDVRNNAVKAFKENPDCKVLFATPQAAKEGLTLTVANHVIFYDRGFNLDDYLQAQDRIHRISQQKTCYIHNLIIRDSVDEWIDRLLDAKQYAAYLAQGDISSKEFSKSMDYSYGEIVREILNIGTEE